MTTAPSRVSISSDGDHQLIVAGVIDAHTADEVLNRLRSAKGAPLTVDLGDVEFIDSSGLRALVTAHQERSGDDEQLVLTRLSDSVRRLLEITGLADHLNVT